MVLFNYSTRELTAKIVYYGPGLCGKTTNLQFIYENLPDDVKGKMLSLATKTDRTLFFDFLPMDLGEIRGMKTRVQLYTVPGQVFYNETRKLVLKGADGVVFVADSQEPMMSTNIESLRNLEENLKAHGTRLAEIPHVIQFNKRDLPRLSSIEELNASLNKYNAPTFEAVATTGIGVQDTLKGIAKLVLVNLTRRYQPKSSAPTAEAVATPEPALPKAAAPAPSAAPSARAKKAPASIPVSSIGQEETRFGPPPSGPPPSVLAAGLPGETREAGMASFAEMEIEEMVKGLREAEPSPSLPASGALGSLDADPGGDEGYFLGEVDADTPQDLGRDGDLFRDPSLEVARLGAGETREIVVPVELQDGKAVRRFKLSLVLRLDPLD